MRWNDQINALEFAPTGHDLTCVIHRLAFRAFMKLPKPRSLECLLYVADQRAAFDAAAISKAKRLGLSPGARFHITSRDVRRSLNLGGTKAAQEITGQCSNKAP